MKRRAAITISMAVLLTVVTAFAVLANHVAAAEGSGITITLSFNSQSVRYEDKPLPAPDFTVIPDYTDRRLNDTHGEKLACIESNLSRGFSPKAAVLYSFPLLEPQVTKLIESINRPAEDATITFKPYESNMFRIKNEKTGYSVNEQRLYYDIYMGLRKSVAPSISVVADELKPNVTAAELQKQTYLRARFTTDYSNSNAGRKHNIRLAMSKINGTVVKSGDSFSFNKTVGARTAARGFQTAKIIVDGEYVEGVGGGVCQASTTLYNAAVLADMTVTAVAAHSLVPSYVAAGFDAMVNSGSQDMTFKNTTDAPVYVKAYGTDTVATVEIYGLKPTYRIERESKIISRAPIPEDRIVPDTEHKYISPDAPAGSTVRVSYGVAGLTGESYLLYYDQKGALVNRKLIRKDTYRSVPGVIAVKSEISAPSQTSACTPY